MIFWYFSLSCLLFIIEYDDNVDYNGEFVDEAKDEDDIRYEEEVEKERRRRREEEQ